MDIIEKALSVKILSQLKEELATAKIILVRLLKEEEELERKYNKLIGEIPSEEEGTNSELHYLDEDIDQWGIKINFQKGVIKKYEKAINNKSK